MATKDFKQVNILIDPDHYEVIKKRATEVDMRVSELIRFLIVQKLLPDLKKSRVNIDKMDL